MTPHEPNSVPTNAPQTKLSETLRARLERHFLSCSALAGTGLGLLAVTDAAQADVFYGPGATIPGAKTFFYTPAPVIPTTTGGTYFNTTSGQSTTNSTPGFAQYFNIFKGVSTVSQIDTNSGAKIAATGSPYVVTPLPAGTTINSSLTFKDTGSTNAGGIDTALAAYNPVFLGFEFLPSAGQYHYGFIELGQGPGGATDRYVIGWAYSTTLGADIVTQDLGTTNVPEPGTLALTTLAMGAAGIGAWRRKRAQAKEATPTPTEA